MVKNTLYVIIYRITVILKYILITTSLKLPFNRIVYRLFREYYSIFCLSSIARTGTFPMPAPSEFLYAKLYYTNNFRKNVEICSNLFKILHITSRFSIEIEYKFEC